MCVQILTVIFTGLTVVAVLAGGAVMLYILTKPKVSILSLSPIHWFYISEGGEKIVGTKITIDIKLLNSGSERTNIDAVFKTTNGETFFIDKQVRIAGNGTIKENIISLSSPTIVPHGTELRGNFILQPWHNRRLRFGKKQLEKQIIVFEDEFNKNKN